MEMLEFPEENEGQVQKWVRQGGEPRTSPSREPITNLLPLLQHLLRASRFRFVLCATSSRGQEKGLPAGFSSSLYFSFQFHFLFLFFKRQHSRSRSHSYGSMRIRVHIRTLAFAFAFAPSQRKRKRVRKWQGKGKINQ